MRKKVAKLCKKVEFFALKCEKVCIKIRFWAVFSINY